ncbi:hypothetical protein ACNF42_08540 [Cuniculiplasma sp. SKW3]|uniref:hypothetical protein n=1 Tax=Cuniculiplasma sp. SKW3 TaxID=3400170 RepID=UPI003FD03923
MVVQSITVREKMGEALQEVGEVRSICDGRDSTTLQEKRDLTLCTPALGRGVFYSSERRYED